MDGGNKKTTLVFYFQNIIPTGSRIRQRALKIKPITCLFHALSPNYTNCSSMVILSYGCTLALQE